MLEIEVIACQKRSKDAMADDFAAYVMAHEDQLVSAALAGMTVDASDAVR